MSHFAVTVLTRTGTKEEVDRLLAPYHEFESTGEDVYVEDVDETQKVRKHYESKTNKMLIDPDGNLVSPYIDDDYNPMFWRVPTEEELEVVGHLGRILGSGGGNYNGKYISFASKDWGDGLGYCGRIYELPEGWSETEVPTSECQSFVEFVTDYYGRKTVPFGEEPDLNGEHKYGYVLLDAEGNVEKVINRTNPNAKWDWHSIGGRGTGYWAEDFDPDLDPLNYEVCWLCGGHGTRKDMATTHLKANPVYAVRKDAKGCNGCGGTGFSRKFDVHHTEMPSDIMRACDVPIDKSTYAMITPDGVWHQKGQMGWWGCDSPNEGEEAIDEEKWKKFWQDTMKSADPDLIAVIVDCHI